MNIEMTAEQVAHLGKIWGNAYLSALTVEERLAGMTLQDRLAGMKPQEILSQLKPQELDEFAVFLKARLKNKQDD